MPAWFEEVAERIAAHPVQRLARDASLRPAAVLVPLHVEAGEVWVVLIRRGAGLVNHAGQYAFPGGSPESGDEDEIATALREASEEIGIEAEGVMVLGQLDEVRTSSGYVVAPIVGALPSGLQLAPRTAEVEAVVSIPLLFLTRPELVEEQEVVIGGTRVRSPIFHFRGHSVSGATARILADLLSRLGLL